MATIDVIMPQMGESITEGTLTRWHKKVGDTVAREEVLFEISTDKVDTEIPSPAAGVLTKILVQEGAIVAVNSVVAVLDNAATAAATAPAATGAPAPQVVTAAPSAAPAAAAPPVVTNPAADVQGAPSATAPTSGSASSAGTGERVLSSPLVRKMAAEHNVDLSQVSGSSESGRINKNDLLAFLESSSQKPAAMVVQAAALATSPARTAPSAHMEATGGAAGGMIDGVRVERVPMTAMRRKIAEHMVMSKRTSPHVTSVIEVDMQKIVDLRAQFKDKFEAINGFKLTFMPFFLQAAVEAIKAVPVVNASVDGDTVIYKKDINLGVAVALDWGLIVPVAKNCSERSFVGLGRELNSLADKARAKKLSPDDVRGGTFSISNFGGFGTIIGQPIINQPQVAIMGIGAMTKKAVVVNDAIAIRTMCYVVLSFDHRVIDGSDSGKFLSTVKKVLENWNLPVV